MGWLGWTEAQTLATRMTAIELAYEGRCDMWRAVFGSGSDDTPPTTPAAQTPTPDAVRSAFRVAAG